MDPRAGLDDVEKNKFLTLPGRELRPLGCAACSQTIPTRYPGSPFMFNSQLNLRNRFSVSRSNSGSQKTLLGKQVSEYD
jgi:hypothetical protein